MKNKILPILLLFSVLVYNKAKANETEPNDTKAQANTLALNGNNTGSIGTATDVDWWEVTTTGDGKLDVTINVSNGKYLWCAIYDNDGTTLLKSDYTSGTITVSKDGLAAGTYYIKLYPFYAGDMPIYTISNILTVPLQANDAEPNGTKAQAKVLALNNKKTGHINYYYNNHKDSVDWYKVTTTADGRLRLTMSSANGQNVWAYLYDNDGTTLLASGYTAGSAVVVNKDGLAAGTYYIRVNTFYEATEWAPYTLADSLFSPTQPNDTEPDSTKAQALTLPLNGSLTGHINYYYNNHKDSVDWYKVTTTADGRLRLTMSSANGQNVWAYLYDNDGTTLLASGYTAGSAVVVNKDGLAAGTYYIRVNTFYEATEWAPYTLADSLFSPTQPNDTEPDSTKAQALTLPLNGSLTGHINYYYNNHKDSVDWYKVTTTADGRLRLTMSSANAQNVWAYLYDNDGTTLLASGYTAGSAVVVNKDGLAAGTYYIRVNTFYEATEWAPYTLADSLFSPNESNDIEPDSTRAQALVLPLNGSKKGHVNYYYNNHKDSVDWYKVTTNADGRLRLTIASGNGQNVWAYLFDNDGTTLLASGYTAGSSVVVNKDGLGAGTYYIRVNTYYVSEWVPYTLSDSLFKASPANDAEPNDNKAQAFVLPLNESANGHTNYYYKLKKDTTDWYSLTTTADGMITISIQSHNGQNVWAYLFDNDGTTVLASAYTTGTTSYSFDGLKAGTYYVRVNTYYSSEWAPYTLSNTLTAYTYNDDEEPNNYFSQAKTLPANSTVTGHVNFYYNGTSDAVDYHKINYTGAGDLTLQFNQQNRIKFGSADYTWLQVYKDTTASPVFSNYFNSPSGDINLTNLTQGYYYLKIYTFYNGNGEHFSSYSITNKFTSVLPVNLISFTVIADKNNTALLQWKTAEEINAGSIEIYRSNDGRTFSKLAQLAAKNAANGADYEYVDNSPSEGKNFYKLKFVDKDGKYSFSDIKTVDILKAAIRLSPNPASSYFIIHHNMAGQEKLIATLYDVNGKAIWTSGSIAADALNNKQVMVNQFGSGFYYLKITNSQGLVIGTIKVVISK